MFTTMLLALTITSSNVYASQVVKKLPEKILTIVVNAKGQTIMGRDTLSIEDMTRELQTRMWKGYIGTGKMPDAISLQYAGEVLMGVRGSVMDGIKKAQDNALVKLCMEKYKTTYDQLNSSKQEKIKRQFPILFQQTF